MSEPTIRLHTKVGAHEFDGEGPPDLVRELFSEWKQLVSSAGPAETPPETPGSRKVEERAQEGLSKQRLEHVFTSDDSSVTLGVLPNGESRYTDAIRLVLYGFRTLLGQNEVLVTRLKASLQQSGLVPDRIDRAAAPLIDAQEVFKTGVGKGGRYRITNAGMRVAEEMVRGMLERRAWYAPGMGRSAETHEE